MVYDFADIFANYIDMNLICLLYFVTNALLSLTLHFLKLHR